MGRGIMSTTVYGLIPLLPLAAFAVIAFGGRRMNQYAHRVGIPCLAMAFALSLLALWHVQAVGPITISWYRLIHVGDLQVTLGLFVDQLTVLLLLLVTGVSTIVHVYSSRYMHGDQRYRRFFAVIALFTFSMIMLVMSANLVMLYIFWEIMGICSYLLISHYSERPSACRAATKAFLVNAVGSVGLGFGVIVCYATFRTFDMQTVLERAPSMADHTVNLLAWVGLDWPVSVVTLIALFLFIGAIGKSSQVPLHVWLPYAMEAPTPVSALIHAATMVNAGVFLVARMSPLFLASSRAMAVVAVVGATTALFGGCLALVQSDIKKILAYSTMSQIGYMMFACGFGAYAIAIFHLLAHGALKACLFLSTGNVVQQLASRPHGAESLAHHAVPRMGSMPIGALLLSLIPPLVIFSGPYEQLWIGSTSSLAAHWVYWGIGFITVLVTAWYVFRGMLALVSPLEGGTEPQVPHSGGGHHWISPPILAVLGVGGLLTIMVLMASWTWVNEFLNPVFVKVRSPMAAVAKPDAGDLLVVLVIACLLAMVGWSMAYRFSQRSHRVLRSRIWHHRIYMFLLNKGYVDDLYDVAFVTPTLRFAHWLCRVVDWGMIDRGVISLGTISVKAARWLWEVVDLQGIDRTIKGLGRFSILMARWLWQVVDLRGIDRTVTTLGTSSQGLGKWLWRRVDLRGVDQGLERIGSRAEETGETLQDLEPRMLQHHLLVLIFWLALVMALVFWLVF
ncbi:MAG: NADH-quinone oxidoreductase subunit L [Nitrospirae bacterium]|nr:MAG: NADH-quinone oxidoreductase subunit L [Nitrospirota bacterium]